MKNSGIAWVGEIPQVWGIGRIGGLYSIRNEKVSDKDFTPLSVTMKGVLPQLETAAKTNDGDNRKLVRKGDFAINSRSDRRGSCGISKYDGSVSLINTILKPQKKMNAQYYDWLFHTATFADEFYRMGHGIVDDLWSTTWDEMKKIRIPIPPIDEQQRIADFLDSECEKIDELKADIQEQIDTLEQYKRSVITEAVTHGLTPDAPMKDCSISWARRIPSHWKVVPNKYLMTKLKNICSIYKGEDILSLTMNGVIVRDLDAGGKMPSSFDGYQHIKSGNLLMCLFDIDVTPRCIGIIKQDGITSPAYSQFQLSKMTNARFYYYYFLMLDYTKELLHLAKNLRHSLTEDQLGAIKQLLPPLEEQQEIAEYLDKKCVEIEQVIADKKAQLETLDEYKKSLIYEYVTGKKEVV